MQRRTTRRERASQHCRGVRRTRPVRGTSSSRPQSIDDLKRHHHRLLGAARRAGRRATRYIKHSHAELGRIQPKLGSHGRCKRRLQTRRLGTAQRVERAVKGHLQAHRLAVEQPAESKRPRRLFFGRHEERWAVGPACVLQVKQPTS